MPVRRADPSHVRSVPPSSTWTTSLGVNTPQQTVAAPTLAPLDSYRPTSGAVSAQAASKATSMLPPAVESMIEVKEGTDERDLTLLRTRLAALHPAMLQLLDAVGVRLSVVRERVSQSDPFLLDKTIVKNGAALLVDDAEGVYLPEQNDHAEVDGSNVRRIVVRSYFDDGVLRLNTKTLLHEIGHCFDMLLAHSGLMSPSGGAPNGIALRQMARDGRTQEASVTHRQLDLQSAYADEHQRLPPYFHSPMEFAAEIFARFMLDPRRLQRSMPKSFAAMEKRYGHLLPDIKALQSLEASSSPAPIVKTTGDDVFAAMRAIARQQHEGREAGRRVPRSIVLLEGHPDRGSGSLARGLARTLRDATPGGAAYTSKEACVVVPAATFKDEVAFKKLLDDLEIDGRPVALLVTGSWLLTPNDAGFWLLESRHGGLLRDVPPVIVAGDDKAMAMFAKASPGAIQYRAALERLDPKDAADLVARQLVDAGFTIDAATIAVLANRIGAGVVIDTSTLKALNHKECGDVAARLLAAMGKRLAADERANAWTVTSADVTAALS